MITKLLKNDNILSLLANLFTSGIAFASFILLARILLPNDFGVWALYLTIFSFADMFRTGVIHTGLIRFASGNNQNAYIGAAWKIILVLTIGISILVTLMGLVGKPFFESSFFILFFTYFPLLFLANLPVNIATWVLQIRQQFQKILYVRILSTFPYFITLIIHFIYPYLTLELVAQLHIATFLLASIIIFLLGWTKFSTIKEGKKEHQKHLLNFGKYSTGTLIGTNLLKSSDSILISWLLGPVALAFYSIPQKLMELIELPVRSLATTALPKLSQASMDNNHKEVKRLVVNYTTTTTLLIFPAVIICILFSHYLILLVGGKQYLEATIILQVFAVYGFFLPLDKFLGITLDCLNLPKFNMIKVIFMVIINIIGDLIAIFVFKSVWAVAAVTTLTMMTGISVGFFYLHKVLKFESHELKATIFEKIQKKETLL